MRKINLGTLLLFVLFSVSLTGCDLIVDIFEAGFVVGVIALVAIIGIIIWLVGRFRG